MEIETAAWLEFLNGRKATGEQILTIEEILDLSKRAGLWVSQSGVRPGMLTIWVRSFEIDKLQQSSKVYQFHQTR